MNRDLNISEDLRIPLFFARVIRGVFKNNFANLLDVDDGPDKGHEYEKK